VEPLSIIISPLRGFLEKSNQSSNRPTIQSIKNE